MFTTIKIFPFDRVFVSIDSLEKEKLSKAKFEKSAGTAAA
jgi:hypothetical protein